jgi:hypothetical protein
LTASRRPGGMHKTLKYGGNMKLIKMILLYLFLSFFTSLYCQEYLCNFDGEAGTVKLTKDKIDIEDINYHYSADCEMRIVNGLSFFTFTNTENGFPWVPIGKNECLILYSTYSIFIYVKDKVEPVLALVDDKSVRDGQDFIFGSSSYLKEKNKAYLPSNLGNEKIESPWVEDANGPGIGETVTIVPKDNSKILSLLVSNGYVSFQKPYLYEENNRIKKINLLDDNDNLLGEYDIVDSPNPQNIVLKDGAKNITVKIVDIYKGTKYDDTCINFILLSAW